MSSFVPSKSHLWDSLLFLFHQKKKAAESHRLLLETHGEHAPVIRTCDTWFRQFKSGDFDLTDNEQSSCSKKVRPDLFHTSRNEFFNFFYFQSKENFEIFLKLFKI